MFSFIHFVCCLGFITDAPLLVTLDPLSSVCLLPLLSSVSFASSNSRFLHRSHCNSFETELDATGRPGTIALKGAEGAAVGNVEKITQMHIGLCGSDGAYPSEPWPLWDALQSHVRGTNITTLCLRTGRVVSFDQCGVVAEANNWSRSLSIPTGMPLPRLQQAIAAHSAKYGAERYTLCSPSLSELDMISRGQSCFTSQL
jgi:hypothetical protein